MTNVSNKTRIDLHEGRIEILSAILDGDTITFELKKNYPLGDAPMRGDVYDYIEVEKEYFMEYMKENCDFYEDVFKRMEGCHLDFITETYLYEYLYDHAEAIKYLRDNIKFEFVSLEQFLSFDNFFERDEYMLALLTYRKQYGDSMIPAWLFNAMSYVASEKKVPLYPHTGHSDPQMIALKQALDLFIFHSETCLAA